MQDHEVHPRTDVIVTEPPAVSDADYEQMYSLLYAYRFGAINFLELLEKFEAILRINSSQTGPQTDPD
jgi:hypothetical protein